MMYTNNKIDLPLPQGRGTPTPRSEIPALKGKLNALASKTTNRRDSVDGGGARRSVAECGICQITRG